MSLPPTDILNAALAYAARGWRVHPCTPDKRPITNKWPHDATTDPEMIRIYWNDWPDAAIGVCTGAPGPDVLDIDVKHGAEGMELFDRARLAGLLAGAEAIVRTPSGGLHLWYRGTERNGSAIGKQRAFELKAKGGYVIAPPSITDKGQYVLKEYLGGTATLNWPEINRLLVPPRIERHINTGGDIAFLVGWLQNQKNGNRNNALHWACCQALRNGHEDLTPLIETAVAIGVDDDSPGAAQRTAESARRMVRGMM